MKEKIGYNIVDSITLIRDILIIFAIVKFFVLSKDTGYSLLTW